MTSPPTFGNPPQLVGVPLQALICESFVNQGKLESTANVVYLKVNDVWYKVALDAGTVHWRAVEGEPQPWDVPEEGWSYPHLAVGRELRLLELPVSHVKTMFTDAGVRLEVGFMDGRRFIVSNTNDRNSHYVVN